MKKNGKIYKIFHAADDIISFLDSVFVLTVCEIAWIC